MPEEQIIEGGDTVIDSPTQEVQDEGETIDSGEGQVSDSPASTTDWKKIFEGKKAKVYGKDIDLSEKLTEEAKVIEYLQKGFASDRAMQERARIEQENALLRKHIDEIRGKHESDLSRDSLRKMVMEDEALREDILWEQVKDDATPEQVAAYEAKRAARERDGYKQKYEGIVKQTQEERQQAIARQGVEKSVEEYGKIVTQGIQNHPYLKHIQSNPMVATEFLHFLRAAERKGISIDHERLANHTWNNILENTILPILEAVPLEDLADKLQGFGKKWDGYKKSLIKDPDRSTPTDGEGRLNPVKAKTMEDIWKHLRQ